MKKIMLLYLYGILIIPISLRIIFGDLARLSFHPGITLHGLILLSLILYFINDLLKGTLRINLITYMLGGFFLIYSINLILVEIIQFDDSSIIYSLKYTFKFFLFILLTYYIYTHSNYYFLKLEKILSINSIILIVNVIIGYHYQLGWQSYDRTFDDSYRGFLAGNDTSIFSFVAFGYSLYGLDNSKSIKKRIYFYVLIALSLYCMYIIATKAIIVSGVIVVLYIINKDLKIFKKSLIIPTIILILFLLLIATNGIINDRFLMEYLSQQSRGVKVLQNHSLPAYIGWLNWIAPNRIVGGIILLFQLFNDSILNILFGYGVSGIYSAYGRPPMTHFFSIIGHFGVLGFFVFYFPQLIHFFRIVKSRKFDLINVLFVAVFLYGSLGGFLYGVANTSILFALLFALSLAQVAPKQKIRYIH